MTYDWKDLVNIRESTRFRALGGGTDVFKNYNCKEK